MAMAYQGIWVYGPDDPRSRLLTDLGFELSPACTPASYNAVGAQTVLSMPLALDVLVPALAAAVDGDPATVPLAKD